MTRAYLPTPTRLDVAERPRARVAEFAFANSTVAILNNGWPAMDILAELLEEELASRGATVRHFQTRISEAADPTVIEEVARVAQGAIVGLGN